MRVVGLITEYNPFHNGHLHHLRESLRVTGADASVAVMSGHFLQRGEPALVDKWLRTEMALAAGVDLVLELPLPFACNSAPCFAQGAVQSLNALGVVDALCFGSEAGDVAPLQTIARLLVDCSDEITAGTRERLRRGISYPVARAEVVSELCPDLPVEMIASPNNILGIEYLRALQLVTSQIQAFTIPRLGADYHSSEAVGNIASATGIRKRISAGDNIEQLLPEACQEILQAALDEGRCLDHGRLLTALQTLLLQEMAGLSDVYQVEAGLDQRLADAVMTAGSYADLTDSIKSRQWTLTRIQRILSYVLLQVSKNDMRDFLRQGPMYLRLLGMTERGREVLASSRNERVLPMIDDPARAKKVFHKHYGKQPESCRLAERMLDCDLRATRIYSVLQKTQQDLHRNQDFYQTVRHY